MIKPLTHYGKAANGRWCFYARVSPKSPWMFITAFDLERQGWDYRSHWNQMSDAAQIARIDNTNKPRRDGDFLPKEELPE
jgi:hypothetical protein